MDLLRDIETKRTFDRLGLIITIGIVWVIGLTALVINLYVRHGAV